MPLATERTIVREMTVADAGFICTLLNQPSFLRYIGDRNVRSDADAAVFIETRYRQSYREHGYGLWVVELRASGIPIGICGFVRRPTLAAADLGFAFLPEHEGHGYAHEAASASLDYGARVLGFSDVLAIVQPGNVRSSRLLERLHFTCVGDITLDAASAALQLWSCRLGDEPVTAN